MSSHQNVFCRKELKYMLDNVQYKRLLAGLEGYVIPDNFFVSNITNLYYDTANHLLIRRSLEKPKYKEKLRLRCYDVPNDTSNSFIEIKKKVNGVVYKRRESLPYQNALGYLAGMDPGGDSQIFHELDRFLQFYGDLHPAMFLAYNRHSYKGTRDESIRITFDTNIMWRTESLDLRSGVWGTALLPNAYRLMEIKIQGAMPLWLAQLLSELRIYPTSVSKYGLAYRACMKRELYKKEERNYA